MMTTNNKETSALVCLLLATALTMVHFVLNNHFCPRTHQVVEQLKLISFKISCNDHSHPYRLQSFWSAPRITTSGKALFSKYKQRIIRFVRLDSEHAQSDRKSINHGLPGFHLRRGPNRPFYSCWLSDLASEWR